MADLPGGAARRRRERQLRSWLRHERMTVRMELAAALHHSAGPETNDAARRQSALVVCGQESDRILRRSWFRSTRLARAPVGCRPCLCWSWKTGGRSRGLLLPPLPHGLCVRGKKGGGGGGAEEKVKEKEKKRLAVHQVAAATLERARLLAERAGRRRKRKKRRKRRTPRTSSHTSRCRAGRRQRRWHAPGWFSSVHAVFPSYDGKPKLPGIIVGMVQDDSLLARCRLRQWHMQFWFCWYFSSRCVPFRCRLAHDAPHHGRYAPEGQLCALWHVQGSFCWYLHLALCSSFFSGVDALHHGRNGPEGQSRCETSSRCCSHARCVQRQVP